MLYIIKNAVKNSLVLALALSLSLPGWAQEESTPEKQEPALGLSTDFGDILIENLGIGRTYNLRELAGSPLKVRNQSTEVVNLLIEPTVPGPDMITTKRKNLGVQPIPSVTWVSVGQSEFILPPNETAFTDVILTIPDDPSLYGKKFQASIHSKTTGDTFLQLGLWSHLVFFITDSPENQAKQEENRKRGIRQTAEFSLLPDKVYIANAPIGKKVKLKDLGARSIKAANIGQTPVELKLTMIQVTNSPLSLQAGYEVGHPTWLTPKKTTMNLDVDSIEDPEWTLHIPKGEPYKGKKYMFVVKVEPTDPDLVSFTFYGRYYVETEK